MAEELGEGDGAQTVVKGEGCPVFGGCQTADFGGEECDQFYEVEGFVEGFHRRDI